MSGFSHFRKNVLKKIWGNVMKSLVGQFDETLTWSIHLSSDQRERTCDVITLTFTLVGLVARQL